jgi:hypothetical protein
MLTVWAQVAAFALAPGPVEPVEVVACGTLGGPALAAMLRQETEAHPSLRVTERPEVCAALEQAGPLPWTPHLIVRDTIITYRGSSFRRRSIRLRPSEGAAEIRIQGRVFPLETTTSEMDFPPATAEPPSDASEPADELFVRAIARMLVRRQTTPGIGALDETDRLLARADTLEVERLAPTTSAVIKQLRAILILEGACTPDTAAGLVRAAARLVPFSAQARTTAALVNLSEAYQPTVCPRALHEELIQSVRQDVWNHANIAGLAGAYELAANVPPSAVAVEKRVDAEHAAIRLASVWRTNPPSPPMGWEVGLGLGLSKTNNEDPRELQTIAAVSRLELTRGRDGPGWGLRLAFTLPSARDLPRADGAVSWTRLAGSIGPRLRRRLGPAYAEAHVGLALAAALARGHDFAGSGYDLGLDLGGEVGFRVVFAHFAGFALWAGGTGGYFLKRGDGLVNAQALPPWDVMALVGLARFFRWL